MAGDDSDEYCGVSTSKLDPRRLARDASRDITSSIERTPLSSSVLSIGKATNGPERLMCLCVRVKHDANL